MTKGAAGVPVSRPDFTFYRNFNERSNNKPPVMKSIGLFVAGGLILLSCSRDSGKPDNGITDRSTAEFSAPASNGVNIHVTESYNDPHRVLMPLKMAVLMSTDKDVVASADMDAPEMVVKGTAVLTKDDFESLQTPVII